MNNIIKIKSLHEEVGSFPFYFIWYNIQFTCYGQGVNTHEQDVYLCTKGDIYGLPRYGPYEFLECAEVIIDEKNYKDNFAKVMEL